MTQASQSSTAGAQPGYPPAPYAGRPPRQSRGAWYWVVTALTFGVFVAIPMWHAYSRLKTPRQLQIALGFSVSGILVIALSGAAPTDVNDSPTGVLGTLSTIVGLTNLVCALVAVGLVRSRAYAPELAAVMPVPSPVNMLMYGAAGPDPAVAAALAARQRREQARALADRDPLLARELCVGRPDEPREFDDGGLVELNSAPVSVIVEVLEVDAPIAEAIVAARVRFNGFTTVEEVITCVSLTAAQEAMILDRGVVLPL